LPINISPNKTDTSSSSSSTQIAQSTKLYQLIICLGKSSHGDWMIDARKEDDFKYKVSKALSITDENGKTIPIHDVKLVFVNRMANTFTYDYIYKLALDYSEDDTVDITEQLNSIKKNVHDMFVIALNKNHRQQEQGKKFIFDFIHLVNGTYNTDIRLPFPNNFNEIHDFVYSIARKVLEESGREISSNSLYKIVNFLWIFAHNPLCAEKNIWYSEQKFNDSALTQQLRTNQSMK
jgi:hypothetical protein